MKIIADCMGSDLGPAELLKGCAAAVKECDIDIIAVGNKAKMLKAISDNNIDTNRIDAGVLNIAIPDQFVTHGSVDKLRAELKIDADSIAERIINELHR